MKRYFSLLVAMFVTFSTWGQVVDAIPGQKWHNLTYLTVVDDADNLVDVLNFLLDSAKASKSMCVEVASDFQAENRGLCGDKMGVIVQTTVYNNQLFLNRMPKFSSVSGSVDSKYNSIPQVLDIRANISSDYSQYSDVVYVALSAARFADYKEQLLTFAEGIKKDADDFAVSRLYYSIIRAVSVNMTAGALIDEELVKKGAPLTKILIEHGEPFNPLLVDSECEKLLKSKAFDYSFVKNEWNTAKSKYVDMNEADTLKIAAEAGNAYARLRYYAILNNNPGVAYKTAFANERMKSLGFEQRRMDFYSCAVNYALQCKNQDVAHVLMKSNPFVKMETTGQQKVRVGGL